MGGYRGPRSPVRRCLASARSWLRPWNRPAMAWPPSAAAAVMPAVTAGTQSAATLGVAHGLRDATGQDPDRHVAGEAAKPFSHRA